MEGLNAVNLNNQGVSFQRVSEKMRKFNALKCKVLTQFNVKKGEEFEKYISKLEQKINSKEEPQRHQKSSLLSRTKSKQKKKTLQQLKLPFEVYIYSSNESDQEPYDEVPFHISDSSISGISEDNEDNFRIANKVDSIERNIFSFAKQKRQFLESNHKKNSVLQGFKNNVLQGLNDEKNQDTDGGCLQNIISSQQVEGIIEDKLKKCMRLMNGSERQISEQFNENDLQEEMSQLCLKMLSQYFEGEQNEVSRRLKQEYFSQIYLPWQMQLLDQKIYLKEQQHQIKQNQLETLNSLLNQIRNNKKIQSTLHTHHIQSNSQKLQSYNVLKNKNQSKSNNKSKKNLIVPLLPLESLSQQKGDQLREEKALTSKRKQSITSRRKQSITSRRKQSNETERSHRLQQASSKSGRRYFYHKDNHQLYRKNSSLNRSKKRVQRQKGLNQFEQAKNTKPQQLNQLKPNYSDKKTSKYEFRQIMSQNHSPNRIITKDRYQDTQLLIKNTNKTEANTIQQKSIVQLKQLQLEQQYKSNLKQVITFQIYHLKNQIDLINQSLHALSTQTQNQFIRIQTTNLLQSLKDKKNHLKHKLKTQINQFWKIAHTSNTLSNP